MSGEKTELELQAEIDAGLETAADEVFGSDVEIAAQAAEEEGKQTPEETQAQLKAEETRKAEEALAKENEGKTPEEIAKAAQEKEAEVKAAEDKEAAEKLAKENEGKTPEQIAKAKEDEEAAAKKEEEEEPYKVPEDMKGRTRERFEKLTGDLKGAHEDLKERDGIIEGFRAIIADTKMNQEEFHRTLELGALLKSSPRKALEELTLLTEGLSKQLGIVPPGADALEGYDDLKQKVVDRELSATDATEIAKARTKVAADKKAEELRATQFKEQNEASKHEESKKTDFAARVETGKTNVQEFIQSITKDPDFEKIGPHLVEASKYAAEKLAPEQWLGYIKQEHTNIKRVAESMLPKTGGTPIMESGSLRAGQKEPQNMEQLADNML